MDGLIEGLLGGLVATLGGDIKNFKPWAKALLLLCLFLLVFIPVLLLLEKITLAIFLEFDFWMLLGVFYLFLFLLEWVLLWGKKVMKARNQEDKDF